MKSFTFLHKIICVLILLSAHLSKSNAQNDDTLPAKITSMEKLISLNFQDIPVRQVLQLIAQEHNLNIIVSDLVQGNVSLNLANVSWSQAMNAILALKQLTLKQDGNIITIVTQNELQDWQNTHLQQETTNLTKENIITTKKIAKPTTSKILKINFAKAGDIAELINGNSKLGLLSKHGYITADERTNTLLIKDIDINIETICKFINSLDIPVKQVQIDAKIVTINEGELNELGVRWAINTNDHNSLPSNLSDHKNTAQKLHVNLATTSPTASNIAFHIAKLANNSLLELELSALQQESKIEVISNPKLITTNKKAAYIEQGSEIPYIDTNHDDHSSILFKKAVLSLKVTPQITADDRLILDLIVTQDRPGQVVKSGAGEAIAINTQRIDTQILVNNGETIVLGGVYQNTITTLVDKVPLLGDLPLIGRLFSRTYENIGKNELLIFITPQIINTL